MVLKKKAGETELKAIQDAKLADLETQVRNVQAECMERRKECDKQEKLIKKINFEKQILVDEAKFLDYELRDGKEQNAELKVKLSKQLTELEEHNATNEQARQQLHQFIFNFNQSVSPDLNINPIGQGLSLDNQLLMEGLRPKNTSFLSGKAKDQPQETDLSKLHGSLMEKKTAVEESKQFGSQLHNTSAPRKSHAYNLEDSLMTSARVDTYNELSQLFPRSQIQTGVVDQSKNTSQMPQDPITEENSRESNAQHSNVNILN